MGASLEMTETEEEIDSHSQNKGLGSPSLKLLILRIGETGDQRVEALISRCPIESSWILKTLKNRFQMSQFELRNLVRIGDKIISESVSYVISAQEQG